MYIYGCLKYSKTAEFNNILKNLCIFEKNVNKS